MVYGGLTNPTESSARYLEQSGYDPLQQQAIIAGFAQTGVVSGCAVTAQGSPDTTVAVGAGSVVLNGATVAVSAGNVAGFIAPSAGNRRIDLVVVSGTGVKSRLAGVESLPADASHSGPTWPVAFDPTVYVLLAEITVDASDAVIVAGCVVDKRVITNAPYAAVDTARLASVPRARGAVCFTWDDGYMDAWGPIDTLARSLNQRLTFCVQTNRIDQTNGPSSANILSWYNYGHEVASHSVSHPNIANIATGLRPAEYDDSKAAIEAIIGAGNCKTWAYPLGSLGSPVARSTGTDRELYLRYDRLLDTAVIGIHPMSERSPFLIARMSWDQNTTHAQVLELIRLCAKKDIILCLYSHNFTLGPTWVQVQEGMNLAASLGVPCLTTAEAFPRNGYLVNQGFEDGLDGWELINSQSPATTNICEVVTDTPATNLQGTKSLHLTLGDTGAVGVKQLVPVIPGRQYKFGCTARSANGTVPGGGAVHAYMRVMELDYAGLETAVVQANSGEISSLTWAATALTYTAAVTDKAVALQIRVMGQAGLEIYVDHVWFAETKYGLNVW